MTGRHEFDTTAVTEEEKKIKIYYYKKKRIKPKVCLFSQHCLSNSHILTIITSIFRKYFFFLGVVKFFIEAKILKT